MRKVIITILILIIIGIVIFIIYTEMQKQELVRLEETVEFLKDETVPIKFKIVQRTDSSLTVAIKFFNADNMEIGKTETTLNGSELSFDFITVKAGNKYISFPYKIFTNMIPPKEGEELAPFYNQDGAPGIFVYDGIHKDLLNNLKFLYRDVKNDNIENLKGYFGNLVHDIEKISVFKTGIVYRIVLHVKGGIEVLED